MSFDEIRLVHKRGWFIDVGKQLHVIKPALKNGINQTGACKCAVTGSVELYCNTKVAMHHEVFVFSFRDQIYPYELSMFPSRSKHLCVASHKIWDSKFPHEVFKP